MPREGSTNRAFRMDDISLWDRFGDVAEPNRSQVLRDFIRWYLREPGAEMPPRPESMARTAEGDRGDDSSHSRA